MPNDKKKIEILLSAIEAAQSNIDNLTLDKVEAMTGGHGTLNIAEFCICNALVDELLCRKDVMISNDDTKNIALDDVLRKIIGVGKKAGADAANCALLSAVTLYLSGTTGVRAGVPAGNRKLGNMARMIAGADRCGVANIPTGKQGNKISGFPAVLAFYQALARGEITHIKGENLPFATMGTAYVHSILGEHILFKEFIVNGVKVATEAMMNCMNNIGAMMYKGMAARLVAAIMGTATTAEIIHPDANVQYEDGTFINSCVYSGKIAVRTAGLPEKVHLKVTGEEFDLGEIVGDIGLILKDIGCPTVVGMMAMVDLFSCFKEWLNWPGGPPLTPLSYLCGDQIVAMRMLLKEEGKVEKVVDQLSTLRDHKVDPEMSKLGLNIIARKAEQVHRGLVSKALIYATDAARVFILHYVADKTYEMLVAGKSLTETVDFLEREWQELVEASISKYLSDTEGKDITVKLTKVKNLGRLAPNKKDTNSFWALDVNADAEVTVNGKKTVLKGLAHEILPKIVTEGKASGEFIDCVGYAMYMLCNISYSSCTILDIVIPSAIASLLTEGKPKEISKEVIEAAYLSAAIPGSLSKAIEVARHAQCIYKQLQDIKQRLNI